MEKMTEPEDMAISSAGDANPSGNVSPLPETDSTIEEKDSEMPNLLQDYNSVESTSTETPKNDAGSFASLNGDSIEPSQDSEPSGSMEQQQETTETEGGNAPVETSGVDAVSPHKLEIDVDTKDAPDESQRIEPEGTTPVVSRDSVQISRASMRFDDVMLQNVLIEESEETQESKESTNQTRLQRIESEDALAIEEEDKNEGANDQSIEKKKPKEPPGTPAKHERQSSETADEREQRIKEINSNHRKELSVLDETRVNLKQREEGVEIEEKKGDDDISLQRGPSGSSASLNKLSRDTWDKNIHRGYQQTRLGQEEKQKEVLTSDVEVLENRYDSPPRTSQRHNLDFNSSNSLYTRSYASNQPQTYAEDMRHPSQTLSPALFVDDDESVPIPHLPPLILPGIGPSYDSYSVQGQGQQVHLNHNGYQQQFQQMPPMVPQQQQLPIPNQVTTLPSQVTTMSGGKRKILLHLWEDVSSMLEPQTSSFLSFRRKKGILRRSPQSSIAELGESTHNRNNDNNESDHNNDNHWADRGTLTVSWYEGTSSLELQEHVQNSVIRKLGLRSTTKLLDFRVLDESSHPPEEIVLCPYIPNGSRLIVRFATADDGDITPPKYTRFSDYSGPPDSPSAAPSPYPRLDLNGLGLNANQLALLGTRLNSLQVPRMDRSETKSRVKLQPKSGRKSQASKQTQPEKKSSKEGEDEEDSNSRDDTNSKESNFEVASLHPEDQIQKSLREITSLLLNQRGGRQPYVPRQEKRQVVFVLANYFVLFLSVIAISAEIQARVPGWLEAMEQQLKNVHQCSMDKESLFACVENGDIAGLIASVILWVSRSAATKRIFLLGFASPQKLWTAVYESLVTATCWGFSYMFIRRGMNPDNNRDFLRRYWKDAVYGSLAGFNAAFMKQVLKNLIPQEAIEDALQERQLKILSWLPSIG